MFFLLDTAERLGFTEIFRQIEPQSPQGKRVKKAVEAYRPGQEEAFNQMTKRLTFWFKLWKEGELAELRPLLSELRSINGILERLSEGESLNEGECFEIKANLAIARKVWESVKPLKQQAHDLLAEPIFKLQSLEELWQLFNPGKVETDRFYLWDEYDDKLAEVRGTISHLQTQMRKLKREQLIELEAKLGRTIPTSGEIMVSKVDQDLLDWIDEQGDLHLQKETFSAYFYKWTPGEKYQSLESHLNLLELEEEQITKRVLSKLSQQITNYLQVLQQNQRSLGELDWILARVAYAHDHNCVPAQLTKKAELQVKQGRHLLVEAEVHGRGNEYTPIDLNVNQGVTLITGSNMGGKTLNLRMVGLAVAMAQHGLCVPARKMRFNLREFIYFSVDDDQTKGDLSTFGQEIVGLNQALPRKDQAGLLLIDELARGTNPEEGSALGKAIIGSLQESNSITIMTTHFSPLTHVKGVRHLKVVGLDQDKYVYLKQQYNQDFSLKLINQLMDYTLVEVEGEAEVSRDAIRVASLLGLDESIIIKAQSELKRARK